MSVMPDGEIDFLSLLCGSQVAHIVNREWIGAKVRESQGPVAELNSKVVMYIKI